MKHTIALVLVAGSALSFAATAHAQMASTRSMPVPGYGIQSSASSLPPVVPNGAVIGSGTMIQASQMPVVHPNGTSIDGGQVLSYGQPPSQQYVAR